MALGDAGVGHVGAPREAPAGFPAVPEGQVAVEHVEAAVVRVAPRARRPRGRGAGRSSPPRSGPATSPGGPPGGPRTSAAARRPAPHRGRSAAWRPPASAAGPRRRCRPRPGTGHHRAGPAAGTGSPARRAAVTTARASASERTSTPSAGSGPGSAPRPHPCGSAPVVLAGLGLQGRRRGDDAPVEGVGRLSGPRRGGRHRGGVADAPQQVDELLHVPDEVAARQELVLEHVGEAVTGGPGVGQVHEARVRAAGWG